MARHVWAFALVAFLWGCERQSVQPGGAESSAQPATASLRIAVIPKGTTHDFWKSVQAGAIRAQRELGNTEVIFRGPEKEDDREQQISLVQNFISSRVDAIVLAPLDDKALLPAVQQATAARAPWWERWRVRF